jgi:hypothetical protein
MDANKTEQIFILNFLKDKNDWANSVEMNSDFVRSGLPSVGKQLQTLLENGWVYYKLTDDKRTIYKINEPGKAALKRLISELRIEQPSGVSLRFRWRNKNSTLYWILLCAFLTIAGILTTYILVRCK